MLDPIALSPSGPEDDIDLGVNVNDSDNDNAGGMSEASRRGTTQNAFVEDASDAIADYDGKGRKVTATTTDKHGSRLFSMPSPKVTILGLNSHQEAHLGYRSDAPTTILPRHLVSHQSLEIP